MKHHRILAVAVSALALATGAPAGAAELVTYSWTTTSQGFGNNVGQPSLATFQVALSAVQSGRIELSDIQNIQLAYPGLSLDSFVASSGGLENAAFVDPNTGAFIFNNLNQGLSVVGYEGGLFSLSFLSITIGNPYSPFGQPLNSVADQFNALKNGGPFAGFPTAGFWTARFPDPTPRVPEPSSWALMLAGFGILGWAARRSERAFVSYG
ncbi:PEP-CTERM sorting domain-containing protein [Sphingomonas sp. ID1715]|uniref:PEPxxWA-CTERM sorting domain-containing protein n=1 Tax=Sphingomonas sp. ID1715 TaxID=1656898 RepID=UPI0014892133|nr:PEPxxWA-CTERM sorting domain-containing protein [Sphingomonas sp. ID1715]NNM75697.1 PEP-CTERM sorting domain-containing protein [Sphingomonas sp. ID1715]